MSNRKFTFFIIAALIILFTSSCGLYDIITLKPPEFVGRDDIDNYFKFRATGTVADPYDSYYFRGFELYYKIYLQGSTVDSNLLSLSELQSKGFKRIASDSDRINIISKPLIPIDSANHDDTFEITVDFGGLEDIPITEPFAAADDATVTPAFSFSIHLRRGIAENRLGFDTDYYKPFSVFEKGDVGKDISSAIWTAIYGDDPVTIALYALSYGKRDLIIDVYSIAVYLFEIDIKLPH